LKTRVQRALIALVAGCATILLGLAGGAGWPRFANTASPSLLPKKSLPKVRLLPLTPASAPLRLKVVNLPPKVEPETSPFSPTVEAPLPPPRPPLTPTLSSALPKPTAIISPLPPPALPGSGPRLAGKKVYSGPAFELYLNETAFNETEGMTLALKAEIALAYIEDRFGQKLSKRISVGAYGAAQAPSSATRGIAYTDKRFLQLFRRPEDDLDKEVIILAHELAHQLEAEKYGDGAQGRADTILLEGLATWIAGDYWLRLSQAPDWQTRAQDLVLLGYGRDLTTIQMAVPNPDMAYELWAAFVDYLLKTYGWDSMDKLYQSSRGRAHGSADYKGIYGKTLRELTLEWRGKLMPQPHEIKEIPDYQPKKEQAAKPKIAHPATEAIDLNP